MFRLIVFQSTILIQLFMVVQKMCGGLLDFMVNLILVKERRVGIC